MKQLKEGVNLLWTYTGYDPQHVLYLKCAHHSIHKHRCRSKRMERTNVRYVKKVNLKGNLRGDTKK